MPTAASKVSCENSYAMGWARTYLPNQMGYERQRWLAESCPIIGDLKYPPPIVHHGGNKWMLFCRVLDSRSRKRHHCSRQYLGYYEATDWTQVLLEEMLFGNVQSPFLDSIADAAKAAQPWNECRTP